MARHYMTLEGPKPFSLEEEAEWDAKEAEFLATAADRKWQEIRAERNQRLTDCDWTQLSDNPLPDAQKADWANYRQALRDITEQTDPFNITWPVAP